MGMTQIFRGGGGIRPLGGLYAIVGKVLTFRSSDTDTDLPIV
jgi:hypothetical protein